MIALQLVKLDHVPMREKLQYNELCKELKLLDISSSNYPNAFSRMRNIYVQF